MRHILVCCVLSLALILATPVLAIDDSPPRGGASVGWFEGTLSSLWELLTGWIDVAGKSEEGSEEEDDGEGENDNPPDDDPDPDFGPLTDPIG